MRETGYCRVELVACHSIVSHVCRIADVELAGPGEEGQFKLHRGHRVVEGLSCKDSYLACLEIAAILNSFESLAIRGIEPEPEHICVIRTRQSEVRRESCPDSIEYEVHIEGPCWFGADVRGRGTELNELLQVAQVVKTVGRRASQLEEVLVIRAWLGNVVEELDSTECRHILGTALASVEICLLPIGHLVIALDGVGAKTRD